LLFLLGLRAARVAFSGEEVQSASAGKEREDRINGLVRVFTGEGQGKTSAALGLALRAVGAGGRVYIARFLRPWGDEEWKGLARLDGDVMFRQFGRTGLVDDGPREDDFRAGREALEEISRTIRSGAYSMVILDDANVAACFGLFSVEDLMALIEAKPWQVDLVIAGCCADPRIIRRADRVTVMQEVKGGSEGG
jgi:cob(I)alamin adenosyltransferase